MNKLTTATFLALMLAKLTDLNVKMHKEEIQEDMFSNTLNSVNVFFENFYIYKIKAYSFIDLGSGFEGSTHILNYLLTYIPIFFILLVLLENIGIITNLLFTARKNNNKKQKSFENKSSNHFLLKLVLGKDYYKFQ